MIRFGILAGVSSDAQVEEKASIPDQIATCRRVIQEWGGVEAACYIMDGYSRTGYDGLSEAMSEIPPLKEAIDAAANNEYDVLILDHFDRLGDLGKMLHNRFKRYRKQLYSARESGRVQDPATYDPWNDEMTEMLIHYAGIKQSYRINKLRRGWNVGIPDRIHKGLPPFRVAYGYDRIDKKTPPVQNENAKYVISTKDWFLQGRPRAWIARQLTEAGAPKPNGKPGAWHVASIEHILLNPFYAGVIAIGQKRPGVSKHGKIYLQRTPQSQWTRGIGVHQPLWDEDTLLAIENEFARRRGVHNYAKVVYPLAGLLRCSICRQKLTRRNITRGGRLMPGLGCCKGEAHVILSYDQAIRLISDQLYTHVQGWKLNPLSKLEERNRLQCDLEEIRARRALIQEGYEDRLYKKEEALPKIMDLEREEKTVQGKFEQLERTQQVRAEMRVLVDTLGKYSREELYLWIAEDESAIVNRLLSMLCEALWVDPEHQIKIDWRE